MPNDGLVGGMSTFRINKKNEGQKKETHDKRKNELSRTNVEQTWRWGPRHLASRQVSNTIVFLSWRISRGMGGW